MLLLLLFKAGDYLPMFSIILAAVSVVSPLTRRFHDAIDAAAAFTDAVQPKFHVNPAALALGDSIASGQYGTVCWAQLGNWRQCVAKRASDGVEHMAELPSAQVLQLRRKRADEYLETEAQVQRLMSERAPRHSTLALHETTVAPYLGSCVKDGCRYLVWRAAGEETLEDFLADGGARLPELARKLGCNAADDLPRRVLRDVLRCLAHVHACGIAHRDIKPSNLLVDANAQTLRLIDFGSAADCSGWFDNESRGLRADRVSVSPLFTPTSKAGRPRAFDDRQGWYKFDVYAAGLVWLCVTVPELAADYDNLVELRSAFEVHEHDPDVWRKTCAEERAGVPEQCAVPAAEGFEAVFGWRAARWVARTKGRAAKVARGAREDESEDEQRQLAWQLLTRLLSRESVRRPSAAEALLSRYLNTDCTEGELIAEMSVPMAAPEPWTIEGLVDVSGAGPPRRIVADACAVPSEAQE